MEDPKRDVLCRRRPHFGCQVIYSPDALLDQNHASQVRVLRPTARRLVRRPRIGLSPRPAQYVRWWAPTLIGDTEYQLPHCWNLSDPTTRTRTPTAESWSEFGYQSLDMYQSSETEAEELSGRTTDKEDQTDGRKGDDNLEAPVTPRNTRTGQWVRARRKAEAVPKAWRGQSMDPFFDLVSSARLFES